VTIAALLAVLVVACYAIVCQVRDSALTGLVN
jgi:hypothetical protein